MSPQSTDVDAATARLAGDLFRKMRQTFINRGLVQRRQDGSLREVEWLGWTPWFDRRACVFVLDTETLPVSIEKLADPRVVHQVSTALGGRRVEVVNHRGVLWILGMDLPPLEEAKQPLPRMVKLDLTARPPGEYLVGLGVSTTGPLWLNLEQACHVMVGGSSDSGKSAFLRSLLFQLMLMPEPVEMVLTDMEGRTFSAFEGLPRLRFPVAEDVDGATEITAWLVDEMERRRRLFDANPYFPEKLAEYHDALRREHGDLPAELRLPWVVAIFDEFTALLERAGRRSRLYSNVGQLAMRSRKYGLTLVYGGQDFKSDLIDTRITNQVRTRVAHQCATRFQSENIVHVAGAERITIQGRALVSLNRQLHVVQGFWVPKEWILALHKRAKRTVSPSLINDLEREMIRYAAEELAGEFKVHAVYARFKDRVKWRVLLDMAAAWERQGWLTSPQQQTESRRVTESLLEEAGLAEAKAGEEGPPEEETL